MTRKATHNRRLAQWPSQTVKRMKKLLLLILVFIVKSAFAQDGSDILYIEAKKINASYIGRYVQIDFFNNSFDGINIDTINLSVSNFQRFKEVRNDDGFNNWFSEQYLESIQGIDSLKFRIQKFKLLSVTKDSIELKSFGHYFKNKEEIFSEFLIDTIRITRKIIHELLVDDNPAIRKGLSIYRVYEDFPDLTKKNQSDCYYCFETSEDNLFEYPLISDWEIEKFDFENQYIILTERGKREIEDLEIPLQGMPVVLTLNGEIIYEFWLWNKWSSFGCDRVYSYPKLDFSIKFGLPDDNKYGNDPRFDERLKKYCSEKYK
jgi:hypothetical protein